MKTKNENTGHKKQIKIMERVLGQFTSKWRVGGWEQVNIGQSAGP